MMMNALCARMHACVRSLVRFSSLSQRGVFSVCRYLSAFSKLKPTLIVLIINCVLHLEKAINVRIVHGRNGMDISLMLHQLFADAQIENQCISQLMY